MTTLFISGIDTDVGKSKKDHSPYTFLLPASPHLSGAIKSLESQCDHLLVEGAGGLCVPFNKQDMLVDLVVAQNLPVVLVTSAKLGSINHTILSLELCRQRNIDVRALVYNHFPKHQADVAAIFTEIFTANPVVRAE